MRLKKSALTIVAIVGAALFVWGNWIYLKAVLADHLLDRAWTKTLQTGETVNPWGSMDAELVAKLSVPSMDIEQIVLSEATGQALAFAPALVDGSAGPGSDGLTAIAAHKNTHFAFLESIETGAEIFIQTTNGTQRRYQVEDGFVLDTRTESLPAHGSPDGLLLITCYPFDAISFNGPLRYVVFARAVPKNS